MRRLGFLFFVGFFWLLSTNQAAAQEEITITSHTAGEAIRGVVPITGTTAIEGFVSWELTFGYADDTTGTWFLIAEGGEPIEDDILTEWDTTTITDGTYNLRLTVFFEEGRRTHLIVPDLRVRNYSVIETVTPTPSPTPTPFTITPEPSNTPSPAIIPSETPVPDTPTPLPTNPVEISDQDVSNSLIRGAAGAFAIFLLVGVYTTVRRSSRK